MAIIQFLKHVFIWIYFLLTLFFTTTISAAPAWKIVPEQSAIKFTAIQNDAPVSGEFKTFAGEINFDPADLQTSHVRIIVNLNSVTTSYQQVADTLKTAEWFNVKDFPQAIFTAKHFNKPSNNNYQATGTLTLRNTTLPVVLDFVLDEYSKTKAHAKGSVTLKRTAFGVGQGEWIKTDQIKDDVKVEFTLTAIKN